MIPSLWVIVALGVLIAYVNGSNDVSKGIATLAGSGLTNYRRAILWGTVWTGLGGFAGALLAGAMVGTFGKGLYSSSLRDLRRNRRQHQLPPPEETTCTS